MQKLHAVKLGLAFAIVWALFILVSGLAAAWLGWGVKLIQLIGGLYIGYAPTFLGSIIGAVWGFIDGFIWGGLIGWIYNKLL